MWLFKCERLLFGLAYTRNVLLGKSSHCLFPCSPIHLLSVSLSFCPYSRACVSVCCCFFFGILLTSFDFVILLFKALTIFLMNFASSVRLQQTHTHTRNVYKVHNYYKHAYSINSRVKIESQEKKNKEKNL